MLSKEKVQEVVVEYVLCDHRPLVVLFKEAEEKLAFFEHALELLKREVVHYPSSDHPKHLPNLIAYTAFNFKGLRDKIFELSKKIAQNNYSNGEIK